MAKFAYTIDQYSPQTVLALLTSNKTQKGLPVFLATDNVVATEIAEIRQNVENVVMFGDGDLQLDPEIQAPNRTAPRNSTRKLSAPPPPTFS